MAVLVLADGRVRWKTSVRVQTHPYCWTRAYRDLVLVKTSITLRSLDLMTGAEQWAREEETGVALLHGDVVLLSRSAGRWGRELVAHDASTGEPLWTFKSADEFLEIHEVDDPHLWVTEGDRRLVVLEPKTGGVVWETPRIPTNAAIVAHGDLVTTIRRASPASRACGLSLSDGRELWSGQADVIAHSETKQRTMGAYYVWGKEDALLRVDVNTGSVGWTSPVPQPHGFMMMTTDELIRERNDDVWMVICDDDRAGHWIYCLDRATGQRRWRMKFPGHPTVLADGRILVSGWSGSISLREAPSD